MSKAVRRVVLLTGATGGIGRELALRLVEDGHHVALTARDADTLHDLARSMGDQQGRVITMAADLTQPETPSRLVQSVADALGAPSVLINNAGAAGSHKFDSHPDDLWESMLAVNLTAPYRLTKAVAPFMLEAGWGRVINVGSIASLRGGRYIAAYTAAKHGLLGLTRALAAEWIDRGITVNMIAPGYVDTPMTEATIANVAARTGRTPSAARSVIEALSPQGRLVEPREIVPAVRMLMDAAAASITGAVIPIDGGASALPATR